jgi:hypothetical protein
MARRNRLGTSDPSILSRRQDELSHPGDGRHETQRYQCGLVVPLSCVLMLISLRFSSAEPRTLPTDRVRDWGLSEAGES